MFSDAAAQRQQDRGMDETLVAAPSVMYSEQQSRVSDKVHSYESRTTAHKAPAPPVPVGGGVTKERGKLSTTSSASSSSGGKEEQLYSQVPKEVDKSKEAILMASGSDRLADAGKAPVNKADIAISVDGPAVGSVRVNRETHFLMRPDTLDRQRIDVNVLSPSKKPLPINVERSRDENAYKCPFVPKDVGSHKIHISLDGTTVPGSPFTCRVYDPERIAVSPITDTAFPQTMSFTGKPPA